MRFFEDYDQAEEAAATKGLLGAHLNFELFFRNARGATMGRQTGVGLLFGVNRGGALATSDVREESMKLLQSWNSHMYHTALSIGLERFALPLRLTSGP